jgi:tetratricopeptide (TPR) repeat protein
VVALAAADWQPELAVQVLQRPLLALAPAWAELEAAQLMRGQDFAHDLVRECALGLLPAAWRLSLHGQLAQAMVALPGIDPARVAEHCWAAERWLDAASTLRQAAQHSRSAGRLAEQEAQLERAAQASAHAGDPTGQFEALADAAAAAMMRLGPAEATARLQALEALAQADAMQARLALLWAEQHFNLGDYGQALQHSARAVALAPAGGTLRHDAQVVHGRALALTGRVDEAVLQLRQAADAAAAQGLAEQEANASAGLAHALQVAGQIGQALLAQQRTVALAQAGHNRAEIAHAASNLAALAYSAGATGLALIHAQEADAHFQAMGASGVHRLWNRITMARCLAASARLDQALAALTVFDTPAAVDNAGPTLPVVACVTRATVTLWQGRAEHALAALPQDDPACMAMVRARLHAVRAQALRAMGQDTAAELAALEALAAHLPALRDDAILALDWACHGPADVALAHLRRLRAQASERGADGLARSLAVREVQRLGEVDAAAARVLASTLADTLVSEPTVDLHANLCPADAWNILADALTGEAGAACRGRAVRWIELTAHGVI